MRKFLKSINVHMPKNSDLGCSSERGADEKYEKYVKMCHGLGPAGNKAPRSRSLTPPPWQDGEEKIQQKKLVGWDKDREGSLTNDGHRQNRLDLEKKKSI